MEIPFIESDLLGDIYVVVECHCGNTSDLHGICDYTLWSCGKS